MGFDITCTGGAGINNAGTMTVTSSTVSNNVSDGLSGGISSTGSLTLTGSFRDASLTLTGSTVTGNTSYYGGGGIGATVITVTNSTISNNTSTVGDGGGIATEGATLNGTVVSGNLANGNGGGIINYGTTILKSSTVVGNTAGSQGGGIYNDIEADLRLGSSTITGNAALQGQGGGIYNASFAPVPVWMGREHHRDRQHPRRLRPPLNSVRGPAARRPRARASQAPLARLTKGTRTPIARPVGRAAIRTSGADATRPELDAKNVTRSRATPQCEVNGRESGSAKPTRSARTESRHIFSGSTSSQIPRSSTAARPSVSASN